MGAEAVPLESFVWPELSVDGETATARAIEMLSRELAVEKMPRRGCPPVCVLISDGFCTDPETEYEAAIKRLDELPWGRRAVRLAIAVGNESEYDGDQLLGFVNQPNVGLLKARNPEELVHFIKWASTAAVRGASSGASRGNPALATSNVELESPQPAPKTTNPTSAQVF